jgi:hypothetical protein
MPQHQSLSTQVRDLVLSRRGLMEGEAEDLCETMKGLLAYVRRSSSTPAEIPDVPWSEVSTGWVKMARGGNESAYIRSAEVLGAGVLLVVLKVIHLPEDPHSQGAEPCQLALGDGQHVMRAVVDPASEDFLEDVPSPGFVLDIGSPGPGHLVQRLSAGVVLADGGGAAPDPDHLDIRVLLRCCSVVGFADIVALQKPHTAGPKVAPPPPQVVPSHYEAPQGAEPFDAVSCHGDHCSSMSGRCTMADLGAADAESDFAVEGWKKGLALWKLRRGSDAVDGDIALNPGGATNRQRRFFLYYYMGELAAFAVLPTPPQPQPHHTRHEHSERRVRLPGSGALARMCGRGCQGRVLQPAGRPLRGWD